MSRRRIRLIPFVLVLVLAATGLAQPGRATEPVPAGWWRLDGNASDSSGNGNDGVLMGDPQWVAGMFAGAMNFDAVDDSVDCGDAPSLNITGELTVSAWIYPVAGSHNTARILDKSSGVNLADPGYKFYIRVADNYIMSLSLGGGSQNTTARLALDSWNYFAFVATGTQWKVLINETWQTWDDTRLPNSVTNRLYLGSSPVAARLFAGMLDDVRVYNQALTDEEIQNIRKGPPLPGAATKPIPEDETTDVTRDVILTWKPGENVAAVDGHIVYLSESFSDVNDSVDGVTLSDSRYDPGRLELGTTYYWRVDEVDATGAGVVRGAVWSFTVEPPAYPVQNVTATASTASPDMGPEKTTDGSGLNAQDEHGTKGTDMWLSAGELPNWIQYEFDQPYKLHEMWVWNSNQLIESIVGLGAKDVRVEYSLDGSAWAELAGVPQFARAPALDAYTHNPTVPFDGVTARYVKLNIDSTWGGLAQAGLSEVRFFYIPVQPREPVPADGATGVSLDTILSWRAGREAGSHSVYLSKDMDAVVNGTAPATVMADARFGPALEYGATYYWRVDEVNDAAVPPVYEGPVWSFVTEEYGVLDDFESYTDEDGSRIYQAWLDGYDSAANGSQVGYIEAPFAERTIVHGGGQSMPLLYSNTDGASFSEAEMTLSPAQNWTAGGGKTLSLWFYGAADNVPGQMYVKVNGAKVVYEGDAADLTVAGWRPWHISLDSFGVNLQQVTRLAIGIDGNGATGTLFFDDIRLYPRERQLATPVEPAATGLAAHYKLDQDAADSSANGNHGTLFGNPPFVPGKVGSAVNLDGARDYIDCGNAPTLDITGSMTISAWIHPTGGGGGNFGRVLDKSSGTGATDPGYKIYLRGAENYIVTLGVSGGDHRSGAGAVLNEWNYIGFVITGTQWQLCLNGTWQLWDETAVPASVANPLYIGNGSAADRHFQGMMDEVRIYNRALTPGEVAWLSGRTEPFDVPF